jgi:Flp pilus assembly protein TadG
MIGHLHRDETGSSPVVELVLGAPLLAVLIWLVVWAGTGGQTPGEVSLAAHDGARLASTIRNPAERPLAVDALVNARLEESACNSWRVTTTSTDAVVTVAIDCQLHTAQMAGLGLGGRTVTVTGRSTIDPFFIQGAGP